MTIGLRHVDGATTTQEEMRGADGPQATVTGAETSQAAQTGADSGSLRFRLRKLTEAHQNDVTRTWTLPGRDGLLRVRYRRLPHQDAIDTLYGMSKHDATERNALLLVKACEEVFGQDGDEIEHLGENGTPIGYGPELAEALGVELSGSRALLVVREAVFLNVDAAMLEHAAEVWEWMRSLGEVEADALGEASAPTR